MLPPVLSCSVACAALLLYGADVGVGVGACCIRKQIGIGVSQAGRGKGLDRCLLRQRHRMPVRMPIRMTRWMVATLLLGSYCSAALWGRPQQRSLAAAGAAHTPTFLAPRLLLLMNLRLQPATGDQHY